MGGMQLSHSMSRICPLPQKKFYFEGFPQLSGAGEGEVVLLMPWLRDASNAVHMGGLLLQHDLLFFSSLCALAPASQICSWGSYNPQEILRMWGCKREESIRKLRCVSRTVVLDATQRWIDLCGLRVMPSACKTRGICTWAFLNLPLVPLLTPSLSGSETNIWAK